MALSDELKLEVKNIFSEQWQKRNGTKIPETDDLNLSNDAVLLEGVVLYADLADSTDLVDRKKPEFAAEIYKTYLHCASKIIKNRDGVITAFDGDRVMAVFIGDRKNSAADETALRINYAVNEIINPAIKNQYPKSDYSVKQSVGIVRCELFVARTGVRGANDLVWVGQAANYAAKLCSLRNGNYNSYITEKVYKMFSDDVKFSGSDKTKPMWEKRNWTEKNITIYRSNWKQRF